MFEFLSIRDASPRTHTLSGCKVMRQWIAVYCEPDSARWSVWMSSGDRVDDVSTSEMHDILGDIAINKRERLSKRKKDENVRVLCYINRLDFAYIQHDIDFQDTKWGWKDQPYFGTCDDYVFVDASPLSKDDFTSLDSMIECISSFGTEVYSLKSTQAAASKHAFFKDISDACWEDVKAHKRYMDRSSTYYDMISGSTAGFLNTQSKKCNIILPDVSSFDKSSAYPSKFVQLDCFPLSKPKVYSKDDRVKFLFKLIESGRWFQVVLYAKKLPVQMDYFKSKYYETYALNNFDVQFALLNDKIWDAFIESLDSVKWRLYYADEQGRLLSAFTDKIVEEWNAKESASSKIERTRHKTQIDMLYGKAIQRNDFEADEAVKTYYKYRGDRYILPHWSRLVVSAVKFEVMSIWSRIPKTIASDTDSVKSDANFRQLSCFFDEINDKIRKRNICSGYDCDIGIWRHEYTADRFLQLTNKQYIYETDGTMHYTLAGFTMPEILQTVDGMTNDEIFNFFKQRPEIPVSQGYTYDWKNDRFSKILQNVKVGDLNVRND